MLKRKKNWTNKRPVAVTIVAWGIVVLFLLRLYQVFEPLIRMDVFRDGLSTPLYEGLRLTQLGLAVLTSGAYFVLVIVGIVVLIGFLRLRRWAWIVLMAWAGISLCISLINYFYSHSNFLVMASNTIIVFGLTQPDVQRIFHIRIDPSEPVN